MNNHAAKSGISCHYPAMGVQFQMAQLNLSRTFDFRPFPVPHDGSRDRDCAFCMSTANAPLPIRSTAIRSECFRVKVGVCPTGALVRRLRALNPLGAACRSHLDSPALPFPHIP